MKLIIVESWLGRKDDGQEDVGEADTLSEAEKHAEQLSINNPKHSYSVMQDDADEEDEIVIEYRKGKVQYRNPSYDRIKKELLK